MLSTSSTRILQPMRELRTTRLLSQSSSTTTTIPPNWTKALVFRKLTFMENLHRAQQSPHPSIELQKMGIRDTQEVDRILSDPIVQEAHNNHIESLEEVTKSVSSRFPLHRVVDDISKEDGDWADLIVSVGGDGTLLKASHSIRSGSTTPLIGVNSSPSSSLGFYCAALKDTWDPMLSDILSGSLLPTPVYRMDVFINGERFPISVLNDVLFAGKLSADTVRYVLQFGDDVENGQEEDGIDGIDGIDGSIGIGDDSDSDSDRHLTNELNGKNMTDLLTKGGNAISKTRTKTKTKTNVQSHKSSGIWVSTASGSTAAMLSAGGYEQAVGDRALQFRVRELFPPSVGNAIPIVGGFVNEKVVITSRMPNSRLFLDGTKLSIPIRFGDEVVLRPSKLPLQWFSSDICVKHRQKLHDNFKDYKTRLFLSEQSIASSRECV